MACASLYGIAHASTCSHVKHQALMHSEHMDSSARPITYELPFSKAERSSELLRVAQIHRLAKIFIDVVFVLDDGVEIPAHRLVLASASAYFRTMFTINMQAHSPSRRRRFSLRGGPRRFRVYEKISITSGNMTSQISVLLIVFCLRMLSTFAARSLLKAILIEIFLHERNNRKPGSTFPYRVVNCLLKLRVV